MLGQVTFDFLETTLAQCPPDHTMIIAYRRKLYELVEVRYGALRVREADGFVVSKEDPFEIYDLDVTSYWYLPRENYAKER
jgi:hypothetical protein